MPSSATITFTPDGLSAYVFTKQGATLYGSESVYEADAPDGVPRRRRTTYTFRQLFAEESFADNEARYLALRTALAGGEGTLVVQDENGQTIVNVRARVASDVLPLDWRQFISIPEVKFSALENLAAATEWDATFTPTGGTAVALPLVRLVKGDLKTDYYNTMTNHRAEGMESIFMEGVFRADPGLSVGQRRAWLLSKKAEVEAAWQSAPDGVLVFGDYSKTVRILTLTFPAGDLTSEMSWMLSAERRWLPGDSEAHAAFKVSTKDNPDTAERLVSIAGTIKAPDETVATVKRTALRDAYLTTGRLLVDSAWEEDRADTGDGAASLRVWSFSYTFRQLLPGAVVRCSLSIAESTDFDSGIITSTYSGRVVAATSGAALTRARDFSAVYPWKVSASETVNSSSEGRPATTEIFSSVEFSYVYRRRGTEVRAMVNDETSRQHFGDSTRTVSGTCIAATEAAALALARTFKPAGVLVVAENEGKATDYHTDGATGVFKQVAFSYVTHLAPADFTLEYTKDVDRDYATGIVTTSFQGTAWAATEAECDRAINTLLAGLANITKDKRGTALRAKGTTSGSATDYLMSKTFSLTDASPAGSGGGGEDAIVAAEWSIESNYSHSHSVLTEIPGTTAHVQDNVGTTIGTRVASGSISTFDTAVGLVWARGKKPAGGKQRAGEQDSETVTTKEKPAPKRYEVRFRYPRSYPSLTP